MYRVKKEQRECMLDFTAVGEKRYNCNILFQKLKILKWWLMLKDRLKIPQCVTTIRKLCYENRTTAFTEITSHKSVKLTYRVIESKLHNLIYNYTRKIILCTCLRIFLLIYLMRHFKKFKFVLKNDVHIFKDATWKLPTANIKWAW